MIKNEINTNKTNEVIELLKIITKQNYFQHENNYYEQKNGLPMGSPLSGILANIFLNNIEKNNILNANNKYKNNIIYWHRYVDDILVLFDGTERQLTQLHNYINTIHHNIKFTMEKESNKTINFLDISIQNKDQQHIFKIYRKPTQTDHTIHNSSNHPYQHKLAAYNHMINRLNNIPMSKEDYKNELNIIISIAQNNGYTEKLIHKINNKIQFKIQQSKYTTFYKTKIENDNKKYISMYYNENTSNIANKILKQYGYTLAHKTNNTIHKNLHQQNNIDEIDCGIYKLKCDECPKFYIGQTGRSFKQRFDEHTREVKNTNINTIMKSKYAQHLHQEKHSYTDIDTNLQIIQKMHKGRNMDRREEYEIYKERNNSELLNDKIFTRTNKLFDYLININTTNQQQIRTEEG